MLKRSVQIGAPKKRRGCVRRVVRNAIVPLANKLSPESRFALVNYPGHETIGNVLFALTLLITRTGVGQVERHVAVVSA